MKNAVYTLVFIAISVAIGHCIYAWFSGLPASLYGMIIFTLLLHFKLCRADKVQQTIQWALRHMGVCFVPAGVGIINHYSLIKQHGLVLVAITFVTTFLLLTMIGIVFQLFEHKKPANH